MITVVLYKLRRRSQLTIAGLFSKKLMDDEKRKKLMHTNSNLEPFTPELRACCRWMNRAAAGKIPINSSGFPISFKDPNNWKQYVDLDEPRRSCLAIDIPFFSVDFDWKRQLSDGTLVEDADKKASMLAVYDALPPTYAERSVSGFGLHLFYSCDAHHKLPDQATDHFEVYARGRQFAMTGDAYEDAPREVRRLSLAEALVIFRLAAPVAEKPQPGMIGDGEPGYWEPDALLALLEAYRERIPGFWFRSCRIGYAVPCPGEQGWPDGARHSQKRLVQNTLVFMRNGWPCFECLHAHCQSKTIKDWWQHYDPLRCYFDFDEWQKDQLDAIAEHPEQYGGAR
jgi:hypothetical protein